ncbi:MAG: FmdB family zinc ribbon protein [Planctomycetota bacterium]|jgi:putative FmdB family regulatory protein
MPTYDYLCGNCDHAFEEFQSMSAGPKRKCPECGELKLKRLIGTGAGVIFKGSGFYETDYRSDSYKQGADSDKKAKEKKGESKSDPKKKGAEAKSGGSKDSPKKAGAKEPKSKD